MGCWYILLDETRKGAPEETTKKHKNYLESFGYKEKGWSKYLFHLDDDRNIKVNLSVMLFHVREPSINAEIGSVSKS